VNLDQLLSNTYRIEDEIGSGGGGVIYKAYHERLQKYVVIKKIHDNVQEKYDVRMEADILKNLRHSYLPQVLDILFLDGSVCTVMDYIPGESFKQLLDKGETFRTERVLKWAIQLCEAVEYLHKQTPPIIHGDIKPANVMLTPNDDICLIDFNVSSVFGENGAQALAVSNGYSPPEQYVTVKKVVEKPIPVSEFIGSEEETLPIDVAFDAPIAKTTTRTVTYAIIDEKSDIYSLGATLYHILTGIRPAKSIEEVPPVDSLGITVDPDLAYIITMAMFKKPERRFSSATQMLAELKQIQLGRNQPVGTKFKSMESECKAKEILVSGAGSGVGTTHTCIMMATALLEQNYEVCMIEYNGNGAFRELKQELCEESDRGCKFELCGIDFYYDMSYEEFTQCYKARYDYVIVDYGIFGTEKYGGLDLTRFQVFIVGSGMYWKRKDLREIRDLIKKTDIERSFTYLIPYLLEKELKDLKVDSVCGNHRLCTIPFNKEPFELEKETYQKLNHILGLQGDKRKGLFRGKRRNTR
jgi:serine/threonine protein kinase